MCEFEEVNLLVFKFTKTFKDLKFKNSNNLNKINLKLV